MSSGFFTSEFYVVHLLPVNYSYPLIRRCHDETVYLIQ